MKIAVSSGHTESVVLAYADNVPLTEDGRTLVVQTSPSLNLHCLVDDKGGALSKRLGDTLLNLRAALSNPWRDRGFTLEDRLVLALPGVSTTRDRSVGDNCVKDAKWPTAAPANFCVVDDTYAGLIAGALSTRGICAFAGTGASVYLGTADGWHRAYSPGKPFKRDGFGAMLGDHGSGFRLAMTTLERICREIDATKVADPPLLGRGFQGLPELFDDMVKQMEKVHEQTFKEHNFLQNWFDDLMANRTPDWRFEIADLAKVITRAAEEGDPFAQELVEEAAEGMVTTLRTALDSEDFADMHSVPIYCQGGMFRHSPFYLARVAELLQKSGKNNPVELARYRPCVGALLIAASPNWTVPNTDEIGAIERAISSASNEFRHLLFNNPHA